MKATRPAWLTFLLLTASLAAGAQEQRALLTSSVTTSAVTAAIGAVINRPSGTSVRKAIARGLVAGAVGGVLTFEGKRISRQVAAGRGLGYAYLAHATASAGASLIENAASGGGLFDQAHVNVGFVRVDVSSASPPRVRFLPAAMVGTAVFASKYKWDWRRTLQTGTAVFDGTDASGATGRTLVNAIAILGGPERSETDPRIAHELVHAIQYEDFAALGYYLKPLTSKWTESHRRLTRWVYPDFIEYGALRVRYDLLEGGGALNYCHNHLEQEASALGYKAKACP